MDMAQANVARRHGDDFQARLFWLKAASLLDPQSGVTAVAYDTGPKSFDDILVAYDPGAAPLDHLGNPILREHIQCKWHTKSGAFGYRDLIDPAFINAPRNSLLHKAHQAQLQYAPDGAGCQFKLLTNWRIDPNDPLSQLVRKESDALDLDRLFDGTTDRSRMGQVRKSWCEHLGIDHATLRLLARTLFVAEAPESSLAALRGRLDDKFAAVGMRRVPASESGYFYDDLIAKLLAQGRVEFDRESFTEMARREGLLDDRARPEKALTIGVRSFMHPIDNLEDRCARVLNLVPYFDGRFIRNETDWQDRIHPELQEFLHGVALTTDSLCLVLDAHVSLAFAAGAVLNVKSGKHIEIEQRTGGRRFWSMDDAAVDSAWPRLTFDDEMIDEDLDEIALAIGLTHDVSGDVSSFVRQDLPRAGRIVHCRPEGGPSQQSVQCGRHAWMLAEAAVQQLQAVRRQGHRGAPVHIFIAGPNSFAFFLGQHQQAIGPAGLHEWDFDGQRGGGYSLGLAVGEARPKRARMPTCNKS